MKTTNSNTNNKSTNTKKNKKNNDNKLEQINETKKDINEQNIKKVTIIKRKINKKGIISLLVFLLFFGVFVFSLFNIFGWFKDNKSIDDEVKKIESITKVEEINDSDKTKIINNNITKDDLYWKYIKMNLINVDFNELKNINNETVGWIKVNGTNINYPFVQTNNNDYYLEHSFYKKDNHAGWVFIDYRNNIKELDKNTIIYAHSRINGTMFGTLKNILTNGWLNNTDNYVIKISTESENTLWQVFSVYTIPTTNDYIQVKFNNKDFEDFSNMLISRSQHNFNTNITKDDKILTLSTCYSDSEKLVLHAKLIKKEGR